MPDERAGAGRHRRGRPAGGGRGRPGGRGRAGRLAPADARHRGRPRGRRRRPATRATPTNRRSRRCSASPPTSSTSLRRPSCSGSSPASSSTPGRRSGGTAPPGRCAVRSWAAPRSRGWSTDPEDAVPLFESGDGVSLEPCHHRGAVGPMAGVVTPSMWMFVLEDLASGRRTYCTLNEGLGKVLRYGAYSPEVLTRLRWMGDVLGPAAPDRGAIGARRHRAGRRHRDPHPDAPDGRRGPQPQPGRHADAAARPLPRTRVEWRRAPRTSPRCCASSAATTTSSSTSRCRPASWRSTPLATCPARRWSSRWPATAPTSASRSPAPATSGSPVRPSWPTGCSSATTAPTTPTPTSATRPSPRPPASVGSRWRPLRRSCGSSAAPCPTRWPPPGGCARSRWPRTRAGRSRCSTSPASRPGIDVTRVCRTGILPQINTGMAGKRRRRRPGRRRAGHPARRDLPEGPRPAGRARESCLNRRESWRNRDESWRSPESGTNRSE